MQELRKQYDKNKDATRVELEFMQIMEITPFLPLLSRFENMTSLSLHGNRLRELPSDMSSLVGLRQLDITNNLFSSIDSVIASLSTLPHLTRLRCNCKSTQQQQKVARKLTNLKELNGHPIRRQKFDQNERDIDKQISNHIKQEDLEGIATLYDRIREVYRQGQTGLDEELAKEFDENVENVMNDLNYKLKHEDPPNYIIEARILCAKYALIDLCFTKMIAFMGFIDVNTQAIFESIHDENAQLFRKLTEIVLFKHFQTNKGEAESKSKKLSLYTQQLERLRRQRDQLSAEVVELQAQNQKFLEKLVDYGLINKKQRDTFNKTATRNFSDKKNSDIARSPSKIRSEKVLQIQPSQSFKNLKILTLNQTRQLIEQMYVAKERYDQKCLEIGKPFETLEQYMYTFFNKKYGLKNLTIEWAKSLINALRAYGQQDNDVAVFAKILRNQLDEGFHKKQKQARRTIQEAHRTLLKIKSKKLNHEVNAILLERQNSVLPMSDCAEIVKSIYRREEAQNLISQLQQHLTTEKQDERGGTPKKSPSKAQLSQINRKQFVRHSVFMNIMLTHKMEKHEQKLRKINSVFQQLDTDQDGILNRKQTAQFIKSVTNNQHHVDEYYHILDPHENDVLTYSTLCSFVQSFPPQNPILNAYRA